MNQEKPIKLLDIALKADQADPAGEAIAEAGRRWFGLSLASVRKRRLIYFEGDLDAQQTAALADGLSDPVLESFDWSQPTPYALSDDDRRFDWAIRVSKKPGVTDPEAISVASCLADLLGEEHPVSAVYVGEEYWIYAPDAQRQDIQRLALDWIANEVIERVTVMSVEEWELDIERLDVPRMPDAESPPPRYFNLEADDVELAEMNRKQLWALTLEELHVIRDHYRRLEVIQHRAGLGLGPQPTDVEMELLAQTWSEHCKHKIFQAVIHYRDETNGDERTIDGLFKTYIRGSTEKIGESIDWLVSVFDDNAGVIAFNENIHLVYKVETHNSPSALDPYGGAITGIVGVNRDPMGTGLGADLLTNVWGYCFARPDYDRPIPRGLMHPRRIRDGVHKGVIDGGNQSGIPYSRGWEAFDDRYLGKPLVFCGTLGTLKKEIAGRPGHENVVGNRDVIVMVGGRIGKDGIHGATFSSAALDEESPAQAVQIGDPITQKKMDDFLKEARAAGLYSAITDNGAGGLGSSIGEMAQASGGAAIDLTKAPLKYPGLAAWEILLSEAQERMTLAVPMENLGELRALAKRRDVEISVLGEYNDSQLLTVHHNGSYAGALDMEFLHGGCPIMRLAAVWNPPEVPEPTWPEESATRQTLLDLLAMPNLASGEEKARQYDHEVKGLSVIKPYVGAQRDIPSDATVMRVEYGSNRGVALAEGVHPHYGDLDAYDMVAASVDEAVRRLVAVGARPDRIAALDNFCWPNPLPSDTNPDAQHKTAQLVRANMALADACMAYGAPLISGKDSMKNDSLLGGVKISVPPTVLISAVGIVEDVRKAVSLDPARPGDSVFLLGETDLELGGSQLAVLCDQREGSNGHVGGRPPATDPDANLNLYRALAMAIENGWVASAAIVGKGGVGVALAKMAMASGLGLKITLDGAPTKGMLTPNETMFSESTGRLVVTIHPDHQGPFQECMAGSPFGRIGAVEASGKLILKTGPKELASWSLGELERAWKSTLGEGGDHE